MNERFADHVISSEQFSSGNVCFLLLVASPSQTKGEFNHLLHHLIECRTEV